VAMIFCLRHRAAEHPQCDESKVQNRRESWAGYFLAKRWAFSNSRAIGFGSFPPGFSSWQNSRKLLEPRQTLEEQFLSPDARRAPLFETIRLGAQLMLQKAFTAQSYKKGLEQAQGIVAMYQEQFPEAMKCLVGSRRDSRFVLAIDFCLVLSILGW